MSIIKIKLLSGNATLPTRGSSFSAGLDLYAAETTIVKAKNKALISTDLQIELPNDCYGRIAPRSGLAYNKFIDVGAGVVDSDYRGPVSVLLFNFSDEDYKIDVGNRIAQLICEKIIIPEIVIVADIEKTDRGDKGFGSSGI